MAVEIGQPAPDFALKDQHGQTVRLSDFRGKKAVVLMFYPFAFSGVCTGELCEVRDQLPELESDDVQLLAVSCDHMFSQRAFADRDGLTFPLLSDFWPHGEVASAFDNFDEKGGFAHRSTFIIDKEGTLRWSVRNAISDARDLKAYAEALTDLSR